MTALTGINCAGTENNLLDCTESGTLTSSDTCQYLARVSCTGEFYCMQDLYVPGTHSLKQATRHRQHQPPSRFDQLCHLTYFAVAVLQGAYAGAGRLAWSWGGHWQTPCYAHVIYTLAS